MDTETKVSRFLRSEASFYFTIASAVMAFAAMYYGMTNQIALLTQELKFHTDAGGKTETVLQAQITAQDIRLTAAEKAIIMLQK